MKRRAVSLAAVGLLVSAVAGAGPHTTPATLPTTPATLPATRPAVGWTAGEFGRLTLRPFATAPFPHPSRAGGFASAAGTFPAADHYADPTVGLFVPTGFAPGEATDYVVYFHGHRNRVANVIPHFRLQEQVAKAGANAVLVVPQGPLDAPDSGGGKLELDDGGFARLLADVAGFLKAEGVAKTERVGTVALAAHSGGYKVVASILHRGGLTDHVGDVVLLDASYGNLDWFADFAKGWPDGRLLSFHTRHLDRQNAALAGLLDRAGVGHRALDERDVSAAALAPRGVTFVPTTLAHDDVPSGKDYLAAALASSRLGRVAGR
jgi:hypothetical protein